MAMSKVLVAGLACAVGACALAAVEGNNTAVVVRKAPVVSDNGYQYLCVPVRGFDITGQGNAKSVQLSDIIPAANYEPGTELIVEGNAADGEAQPDGAPTLLVDGTYKCKSGTPNYWVLDGNETDVGTSHVKNGARLWLNVAVVSTQSTGVGLGGLAAAKTAAAEVEYPETIFAGEQVPSLGEGEYLLSVESVIPGTMLACGNNTSEPIDVKTQLIETLQDKDQILRVQEGSDEYCYVVYRERMVNGEKKTLWTVVGQNMNPSGDAVYTIAPGEAFYFYRQPAAQ